MEPVVSGKRRGREEAGLKNRKMGRREALGTLGVAGAALAFGCGESPTSAHDRAATPTTGAGSNAACAVTPSETVGPFPSLTDLFRSDIREDKTGTRLTLTVRVVNVNASCAAVPGANVEIWHVDAAGNYSQYGTQAARRTCAASRPPTATARSCSPRSTRAGTRAGPPTSTSRSRSAAGPSRSRRSRSRRPSTRRCTAAAPTRRGDATRSPTPRTGSSRTACRRSWSRRPAIPAPDTRPAFQVAVAL